MEKKIVKEKVSARNPGSRRVQRKSHLLELKKAPATVQTPHIQVPSKIIKRTRKVKTTDLYQNH